MFKPLSPVETEQKKTQSYLTEGVHSPDRGWASCIGTGRGHGSNGARFLMKNVMLLQKCVIFLALPKGRFILFFSKMGVAVYSQISRVVRTFYVLIPPVKGGNKYCNLSLRGS